jgi:hypothetical protein
MMEEGRLKTINPAVDNSFARASHMPQSPHLPPSQMSHMSHMSQGPLSPQMLSPQLHSSMQLPPMHSPMQSPHQSYYADPKLANHPAFRDDISRQSGESPHSSQGNLPPYQDNGNYHNDIAKTSLQQPSTSAAGYARPSQHTAPPPRQFAAELPGSTYHLSQHSPNLAPRDNRNSTLTELSGSSPTHKNFPSPNIGGSDRSSVTSELPNSTSYNNSFHTSHTNMKGMPSPGLPSDRTSMVSGISEMATPPTHQHGFQQR